MIDSFNINFDNFCLGFLGFRIQFGCLHIPQGHYFRGNLWHMIFMDFFYILNKSPPLKIVIDEH